MGDPRNDESDEKRRISGAGVTRDQKGNAVWKWAADSGRHLMESTTALLKRLEVPGLRLEDDVTDSRTQAGNQPGQPGGAKREVGYDPYGSKRAATSPPRPAARATRPATKPAAVPPPRRSWWRRLFGG